MGSCPFSVSLPQKQLVVPQTLANVIPDLAARGRMPESCKRARRGGFAAIAPQQSGAATTSVIGTLCACSSDFTIRDAPQKGVFSILETTSYET